MKFLVFGLAVLAASTTAFPEQRWPPSSGEDFAYHLRNAIEDLKRYLVGNNLDPLDIPKRDFVYVRFPFINIQFFVKNLKFQGLSNIVINELDYSNIFSRLRYDFVLPELDFAIENASFNGTLLSEPVDGLISGRLNIKNIRLFGDVYVQYLNPDVIITELTADFSIENIESAIVLNILGEEWGDTINKFLNKTLPEFLNRNAEDINRLLARVIRFIAQIYLAHIPSFLVA